MGLVALILCCGLIASVTSAQPPGTMPVEALLPAVPGGGVPGNKPPSGDPGTNPKSAEPGSESLKGSAKGSATGGGAADDEGRDERELNLKAFLLLDEAGNPVIMPGMTFEKLDQLQRMQEGWQQLSQLYTIESLEVRGRVVETTAELNITARIDLEPTAGSWVSVPLRMGNFHLRGPADVSGVERYRMDLVDGGAGYLLHLKSETRRSVVVTLRVVARVSPPPGSAIEFRLPEAPTRVVLEVPSPTVSATVLGRGDEVLETNSVQNSTELTLNCGGGTLSLRFGTQLPVVDTRPILETESRLVVDWQQADNAPIVSQEVAVRSGRGDLRRFDLALPAGMSLLQQPTVRGGAPFEIEESLDIEPSAAGASADGEPAMSLRPRMIGVVPTSDRGDSRVEIGVAMQLRSEDNKPGGTVIIRAVSVDEAIEQTGEIEVRTPRDYRLRWTPQPWVTSLWDQAENDAATTRIYRFRFERVPFELPVWLSARAKRLRVEGDYRLTFYDSMASLKVLLRTSGGVPDSRILPIDVAGWRVQNAFIGGTTTPVQIDQQDDLLEIDLASLPAGGESDRIEIALVRSLAESADRVDLPLPRIAGDPDLIGTIASSLSVVTQADYRFIADLGASTGLGEVLKVYGPAGPPEMPVGGSPPAATRPVDVIVENRYSLPDIAQPGRVAGFLVVERPRISYQADAEISISGNELVEELDWVIYPQGGLRGRLPIAWGRGDLVGTTAEVAAESGDGATGGNSSTAVEGEKIYRLPAGPLWTVTVDDTPAVLRATAEGEYSIYSELLASGPHRVRFQRSRELPAAIFTDTLAAGQHRIAGVELPRPGVSDVNLRGPMSLRLRGDLGLELAWRDSQGQSKGQSGEAIALVSKPIAELPLRVRSVDRRQEEVVVRRAVLRTAVSRDTHHDYLLASVEGGGLLRLPVTDSNAETLVRASVDGVPSEVLRSEDGTCAVQLGGKGTHTVSIQLWSPRESSLLAEQVRPMLKLPTGTERFYWEIVTPQDDHLVWASPTAGRAMRWQSDRWRLYRQPVQTGSELAAWVGGSWETRLPQWNRYLFVGVDAAGLHAVVMSRMAIWLITGTAVLLVSCLLTYFPRARHPLLAVTGAVLLSGMMLLLPDASVLAGQVMLVAMLMVAVMAGVGYLLAPKRPARVLVPMVDRPVDRPDRSSVRGASRGAFAATAGQSGNSGRSGGAEAVMAADSRPRGSAAEARS